jgi:hypothetical protein
MLGDWHMSLHLVVAARAAVSMMASITVAVTNEAMKAVHLKMKATVSVDTMAAVAGETATTIIPK